MLRHLPPRVLGSAVGGLIVVTNVRTLLRSDWLDAGDAVRYPVYAVLYLLWAAAITHSVRSHLRQSDVEGGVRSGALGR